MSNKKQDIYASVDIEADGRVPGLSSMLSFATALYDIDKNLLGTFTRNLELLPGAKPEQSTENFWNESEANKAAYAATRVDIISPEQAMTEYVAWLKQFKGVPIFVGYPAAYDFKWIDFYTIAFTGDNPFGFSRCIDVKTYAWAMLKQNQFTHCAKRNMPKHWFDKLPHTHVALDDAIEQGAMFINMHRYNLGHARLPDISV